MEAHTTHGFSAAAILSPKIQDGLIYRVNREKHIKITEEDGNISLVNSSTERATGPFTIGRINWHIIDTIHGA